MQSTIKTFLICFFLITAFRANSQNVDDKNLLKHIAYLSSDKLEGRKTGTSGNREARNYILEEFKRLGLESHYPDYQQKFAFENRREKRTIENAVNVIGYVPGKSSRKLMVITAHYDHVGIGKPDAEGDSIYNGADDNASGTAALLVLADYFKKNTPEHGILFAALDGEEMGLQGAKALVNDFPFPLEEIVININMDMISRNEKGEIYASGTYYNPSLKAMLESASSGMKPKLMFGHDEPDSGPDNWTQSSDHGPFFNKSVPHIYFGVEDHQDYHKPSDEFSNIDQEFYVNAVNLILKCTIALDGQLPKQ